MKPASLIPLERIQQVIFLIRGEKVMLDADIAALYGVETKYLIRAVKRNAERFPDDFAFQLTPKEFAALRCQFGTSKAQVVNAPSDPDCSQTVISNDPGREAQQSLRSQIATSKPGRGGRRYRPYAFTEQGVAMLSSVLRSRRAVEVNVAVMRAFVALRRFLADNAVLAKKLDELERKVIGHDAAIRSLFDAIRQLMAPPEKPRREIGFHTLVKKRASMPRKKS